MAILVLAVALSGLVVSTARLGDATSQDRDDDGLSNEVETLGWRTLDGRVFVTDPDSADSDDDGLSDGLEAGALVESRHFGKAYVGISNPGVLDTDGDKVWDVEEFLLDTDPRSRDTDEDDLPDNIELRFGSDPLLSNPDGDSYGDLREFERGSDPLGYDLNRSEAVAAFVVGATAGDCEWCARNIGRLRDEQIESSEYLAGQIASGVVGIGDVRDFAAAVGKLDIVGAVVNVAGLVPGHGDVVKTARMLATFSKRGPRAERSVSEIIARLPWSGATKMEIRARLFGGAKKLPYRLEGGPRKYAVYVGRSPSGVVVYCGITNDFARRKAQHAARSFTLTQVLGADGGLSRGEARAIEEACIRRGGLRAVGGGLENKIHSINPNLEYYADGVAWGRDWWTSNAPDLWSSFDRAA